MEGKTTILYVDVSKARDAIRQLFVLNECTLIPVIARALSGKRPVVLFVDARIRLLTGLLIRIFNFLEKRKKISGLEVFGDTAPWPSRFPLEKNLTHGAIADVEGAIQDDILRDIRGAQAGFYLYPMKKAVTEYSEKIKDLFLVFSWLEETQGHEGWVLHGAPRHFDAIHWKKKGRPPGVAQHRCLLPTAFFNTLNLISLTLAGLGWLAARIRFRPGAARVIRLAVDRISALDNYIFTTVIDDPAELVIVDRSKKTARGFAADKSDYETRLVGDTRISLFDFFHLGANLLSDSAWIWCSTRTSDPALFGRFVTIAAKRAMYKAFFKRFRPRFYWGRDDYSLEHVIRNRELRTINGTSLGDQPWIAGQYLCSGLARDRL